VNGAHLRWATRSENMMDVPLWIRTKNARRGARYDAYIAGEKIYFLETTCKNGHDSPRYTKSTICVACAKERNLKWYEEHK
jgi:hypothetical protein